MRALQKTFLLVLGIEPLLCGQDFTGFSFVSNFLLCWTNLNKISLKKKGNS